jgi:H+/Cl- antiporter ClcA
MTTRRITSVNTTAVYLIMALVVVVAFFLLGGAAWLKGLSHGNSMSMGMAGWNWTQILIGLAIGFVLGLLVSKWKR